MSRASSAGHREDPYGDSLREWPQHAGALDLDRVLATMERIAGEITPTSEGRFSGPAGSPC